MSKLVIVLGEHATHLTFGVHLYVKVDSTQEQCDTGDYLLLVEEYVLPIRGYQSRVIAKTVGTPGDLRNRYRCRLEPIPSGLLYPPLLAHKNKRVREAIEQILNERDPLALLVYRSEHHESHL